MTTNSCICMKADKFLRIFLRFQDEFADGEARPELLAIKFGNVENAKKFKEKVTLKVVSVQFKLYQKCKLNTIYNFSSRIALKK